MMEEKIRRSINEICSYLALRDVETLTPDSLMRCCGSEGADVMIVLGSDLPHLVQTGCAAYKKGICRYLLFCGGKGHSTGNLRKKTGAILNCDTKLLPESEAELYACLAREKYGIPEEAILLEKHSTNTMENLKFGRNILNENHITCQSVLLIQDPLLQRRSYVTALDFFERDYRLLSYAPFVPGIDTEGEILPKVDYLWDKKRFLELVMGEIWRLRDDEHGYGPRGAGFLRHVEIPEKVEQAYDLLLKALPDYAARCQ